ncbi:uncharacterized protein L969DRAFT_47458 [Mixia osmundae IAM 14324]|uniref:Nudix hydrolase domain-containing protein n=1 Tax=Mixia osmundae (strain CBS 9802 / IAM 14324 / JCM 22182 / KY 12970) TaxID=764103 RepID=G7E9C7_MIXOS|nr:uncharacterized protein L969DRAFT_47458 [Mixia osmundae IAM 14324]KEI39875.1 hypothetical protein L969DRAFT_47458 [Mixia osmundae IAM 14324]GAA99246.1 hypothetical protein E5Q_05940 [Mixia osmundae IAM 14324]
MLADLVESSLILSARKSCPGRRSVDVFAVSARVDEERWMTTTLRRQPFFDPLRPLTRSTAVLIGQQLALPRVPHSVSQLFFGDNLERWSGGRAAVGVGLSNVAVPHDRSQLAVLWRDENAHERLATLGGSTIRPAIVLTVRGGRLRSHAGEISLTGGKIDASDSSACACYVRETHEEIGLPAERVQVLGELDPTLSKDGLEVASFVAVLHGHSQSADEQIATLSVQDLLPNPGEVQRVFAIPLYELLDPNRQRKHAFRGLAHHEYRAFDVSDYTKGFTEDGDYKGLRGQASTPLESWGLSAWTLNSFLRLVQLL